MRLPAALDPVAAAWRGDQLKPTVVLLLATLLQVTWKYFGSADFFRSRLAGQVPGLDPEAAAAGWHFLMGFVLLGLVPALVVKGLFRQRLADYGVQLGIPRRTVRTFLIFGPLFLLAAWIASSEPALRAYYPLNKNAGSSPGMFALHACGYLFFYAAWEFHFRGFIQHGLRTKLGDVNAVLIQVLAACLVHIGHPASEIYGSIVGSLLWGILAFRTRSLLSGILQHALLGIALDWFICYGPR